MLNLKKNPTTTLPILIVAKKNIAAAHPLDRCAIEMAPAVLKLLLGAVDIHIKPKTRGQMKPSSNDRNTNNEVFGNDGTDSLDFVMVMDASFLGGLLFSEMKLIPTIAIGSHHTLMLAIEHEPKWNPSPKRMTMDRMDKIFLQRLYSFGLTGDFIRANQMRHSLGLQQLKRLTSPLDHLLPVVALLVDLIPSDVTHTLSTSISLHNGDGSRERNNSDDLHAGEQRYGYRVHNIQPLLSPCTLCLGQRTPWKNENNSSVIMVAPQTGLSAKWIRSLIRALSMTKQSLEGYDDCLFDRISCQNGVVGFEVDWLTMRGEEDDNFPPVVPSFIHREVSVSLLDSAIRNQNTMVALIHCDSESNILASFGIEVFCISQNNRISKIDSVGDLLYEKGYGSDSASFDLAYARDSPSRLLQESISRENINPEEVATKLLSVLRRKSTGSETSITTEQTCSTRKRNRAVATWIASGLQRTVTIVQAAAQVHRANSWDNLQEMQRITSSAITKALHSMDDILQDENFEQVDNNRERVGGKQEVYDGFTVFLAWLVFLSAIIYIIFKESTVMKRWRQHRHHYYHRNGGSFIDSILIRLKDLDDAWDLLLSWSSEFSSTRPVLETRDDHIVGSNENAVSNTKKEQSIHPNNKQHNSHHHGQMRRRRKMKTTR